MTGCLIYYVHCIHSVLSDTHIYAKSLLPQPCLFNPLFMETGCDWEMYIEVQGFIQDFLVCVCVCVGGGGGGGQRYA